MADIRKNMILFNSFEECISVLRNRSISAVIWASYVANQPPGDLFDKSNMAVPFAKGSYMVDHFSYVVLQLRENGVVEKLVKSWWIDRGS